MAETATPEILPGVGKEGKNGSKTEFEPGDMVGCWTRPVKFIASVTLNNSARGTGALLAGSGNMRCSCASPTAPGADPGKTGRTKNAGRGGPPQKGAKQKTSPCPSTTPFLPRKKGAACFRKPGTNG